MLFFSNKSSSEWLQLESLNYFPNAEKALSEKTHVALQIDFFRIKKTLNKIFARIQTIKMKIENCTSLFRIFVSLKAILLKAFVEYVNGEKLEMKRRNAGCPSRGQTMPRKKVKISKFYEQNVCYKPARNKDG